MKSATRIILGGAGTRILCYVGALRALDKYYSQFKEFVGVSAGSIISMLMALGLSINDIESAILSYNFRDMFHPDPFSPDHILDATESWGLDDGIAFKKNIAIFLEGHGFSAKLTFEQLARLTKKNLRILACDIEEAKYYEFSNLKTPKTQIIDAVYASCAIPIYFYPAKINNKILVDGGLIHSFPLTYFTKKEIDESIGIQIISNIGKQTPTDSLEYFWRICNLILHPAAPYKVPVNIYSISIDSFFLNWNLNQEDKKKLVLEGYKQVKKQMDKYKISKNIYRRYSI
jgi:predicted acylesterase/phospholipase RssA